MRAKKHTASWRILMGGRPWEDKSQSEMHLNYLQRVHLQTRNEWGKSKCISQRIPFLDKGVPECV